VKVLFLSANAGRPGGADREIPAEVQAGAAATQLSWLDIDREYNEVQVALGFPGLGGYSVIEMIPAVQWDQMQKLLSRARSRIVLHFSGHGGSEGLYMINGARTAVAIKIPELVRLVTAFKDNIALIVLNACYTAELAEELTKVIDVVVGMEKRVRDVAAILFSRMFYDALIVQGASVASAFEAADRTVTGEYGHDVAPAIIKARIGVDPTVICPFQPLDNRERDAQLATELGAVLAALVKGQAADPEAAIARLCALEESFGTMLRSIELAIPDVRARPPALRVLEDQVRQQLTVARSFREVFAIQRQIAMRDPMAVTR
jgi:hypothetical protein